MHSSSICVIGSANIDIAATSRQYLVPADSNPGHVSISFGGVGNNIAHNLSLLGERVEFITCFGNDAFGRSFREHCEQIGMSTSLSLQPADAGCSMYVSLHNPDGEMQTAVADVDILERYLTPTALIKRIDAINTCKCVVADCNLTMQCLVYLLENVHVPLFVDTVSTAKAIRLLEALWKAKGAHLHTLKLNHIEAQTLTSCANPAEAAAKLHTFSVENVYITMGAQGVYCSRIGDSFHLPAEKVAVVNATGAGDAFLSALIWAYTHGKSMRESATLAQKASRSSLLSSSAVNPNLAKILE